MMLIVVTTVERGRRIRLSNIVVVVGRLELRRRGVEEVIVKGKGP